MLTLQEFTEYGAQGGRTRAAKLSAERRREIARLGGKARHRPRIAHQYLIRQRAMTLDPHEPLASLDGCVVQAIPRDQAKPIILRYEWLGTMGAATAWYGLRGPDGDLLGVVGLGRANLARDLAKLGSAVCLQRGACVHWAPKNAASFLIRRAIRLAHQDHGWTIFCAYADPDAGEIGTIYQALGWSYTGQGTGRTPGRKRDHFVRPDGRRVDERMLRHGGVKLGDVLGWTRIQTSPKHRYVWIEDPELRASSTLPSLPYPKRPSTRSPASRRARETALAEAIDPSAIPR